MILVLVIFVVCNIAYILFIIQIFSGWEKLKIATIDDNFIPTYGVSVIIAARNEEKFIQKCIQSILANQYPDSLFEIIVIDDHSSDNTRQMAENIESTKISVFHCRNNYLVKKQRYLMVYLWRNIRSYFVQMQIVLSPKVDEIT